MEWTYKITAAPHPRLLARVVQIFDQQMLTLQSLQLIQSDNLATIRITVDHSHFLAQRIQAQLYHIVDILTVELIPASAEYNGRNRSDVISDASATTEV